MERRTMAAAAARHGAAPAPAPAEAPRRPLPPGFRFHPTDEELVVQYLRRKALARPLPAAVIPVVHDAARLDPWDLPGVSEGEAYFFSLRQAPASGVGGGRRRRACSGYWKATGKEKPVFLQGSGCGGGKQHLVGVKTALAFHRWKALSSRTSWVMHEYRLAAAAVPGGGVAEQRKSAGHVAQQGEWVVCRVSLKNRARRQAGEADSQTPAVNRDAAAVHRAAQHWEDVGPHQPLPSPLPSPSSSSCVIDVSDQEEVSSSSSIQDAPAASQREA